jgi:hypothetical protein
MALTLGDFVSAHMFSRPQKAYLTKDAEARDLVDEEPTTVRDIGKLVNEMEWELSRSGSAGSRSEVVHGKRRLDWSQFHNPNPRGASAFAKGTTWGRPA